MKVSRTRISRSRREQKQDMLAGLVECTPEFMEQETARRLEQHPTWSRNKVMFSIYDGRIGKARKGHGTYIAIFENLSEMEIRAIPLQLNYFITFVRCGLYPGVKFFASKVAKEINKDVREQANVAKQINNHGIKIPGEPIGGTSRRVRTPRHARRN